MDSNIRNIIFDWGGVLIDLDFEGCVQRFEQLGATGIRSYLAGRVENDFFHLYECGEISTERFREEVRAFIGKPLPDAEVDALWNSELLTIPEYKLRLLKALSKNYRIYLLSNTNELHWAYGSQYAFHLEGEDLKTCFTQVFLSHEMRLAKPDVRIFNEVLAQAGLKPEETLFIDDAEKNCKAAAAVGIHTAHYVPGEDLTRLFRQE